MIAPNDRNIYEIHGWYVFVGSTAVSVHPTHQITDNESACFWALPWRPLDRAARLAIQWAETHTNTGLDRRQAARNCLFAREQAARDTP